MKVIISGRRGTEKFAEKSRYIEISRVGDKTIDIGNTFCRILIVFSLNFNVIDFFHFFGRNLDPPLVMLLSMTLFSPPFNKKIFYQSYTVNLFVVSMF